MRRVLLSCFLFLAVPIGVRAQAATAQGNSPVLGSTKLLITGDAEVSYVANSNENAFGDINFKPIFLWQLSDRLFVESEIEVETGDGQADFGLEYVNVAYTANDYVTFHAGRFLSLFDGFFGKFGEGFLNRFPSNPVGYADGGIGSLIETGVGIEGNIPVGTANVNYDFYLANGPQLLPGSSDAPEEAGQLDYETFTENNKNKAVGGRVGIVPLSDKSLEVGFAFQTSDNAGETGSSLDGVNATMFAVDLNYYHTLSPLHSTLRLNGDWKRLNVGSAQYDNQDAPGTTFTFDNSSSAYYIQALLRPTGASNPVLQRIEFAFRHSSFDRPSGAPWGGNQLYKQEVGLSYWFKWNALLKVGFATQTDETDTFLMQLVYGF